MPVLQALVADLLYHVWITYTAGPSQLAALALGVGGLTALLALGGHQLLPDAWVTPRLGEAVMVAYVALAGLEGPARLLEEHRLGGTLEQLYLSPVPLAVLGAVRSLTTAVGLLPGLAVALVGVRVAGHPVPLDASVDRLALWVLVFAGCLGLGYAIGAWCLLAPGGARLLGWAVLPVTALALVQAPASGPLATFLALLPPAAGTRLLPLLGQPGFWTMAGVGSLALGAAGCLMVGAAAFLVAERRALRRGTVVRYFAV